MKRLFKKFAFFMLGLSLLQSFLVFNEARGEESQFFYADSEIPAILPRSTWEDNSSLVGLLSWLPQNQEFPSDWQTVERFIIHDTGCDASNPTCNNNQNPVATIQGIYRFHSVTRGWGDIGYNYIIDQQGRIYEGKFGGNGVRGAHTYYDRSADNFNFGSIGIAFLGNYSNQDIPAVMYESSGRLIGWLAAINNLDPQGVKNSLIWNLNKGGFVSSYSGPVVAGHRDIEVGNPDPGMVDLAKVRQLAVQYKQKYQGLVYQVQSGSKIYQLENGARKIFDTISDFLAKGGSYQKLAAISQSQLDLFSESRFFRFSNGSLLQISGLPSVYLIEEGKRRNLTLTAKEFTKLGFEWDKIIKVTNDDLISYPDGLTIVYGPEKELLSDSSGKVYFIENGRKKWITSANLFKVLSYQWTKVKAKDAEYLAKILDGTNMAYPNGTLLKGSDPTVYLIENGQKREFLSEQSFLKLSYQKSKIISVASDELARYPDGQFVHYEDNTLVKLESEPTVYLTSGGNKKSFISAEHFLNLGYQWKNIVTISNQEFNRYSFAGDVAYPEGTLLQKKAEADVYRIDGGLAKLIPDPATFNKLKLSWSKILKISASDFGRLFAYISVVSPSENLSSGQTDTTQTPAATVSGSGSGPNVRVGVWKIPGSQTEVVFGASGPYDVYDKDGQLLASKQKGETISFVPSNGVFAKLAPKEGTILEAVSLKDIPSWKPDLNYNKFRGNLELVFSKKSNSFWVVNELPLEEYLKGVAETNQGLAMEYLKTMAVAARTYAYHYQQLGGKYGSDEVYHITNTTADQLYKGYGREPYASDIVTAAQATFGEMAIYNGQSIVTAYSSGAPELLTSGSRAACSVWGGKYCDSGYEYLKGGVKDPEGAQYSYNSCGSGNHCVGLSGAGTRRWATLGKNYKEILIYYYPGTEIKKIY